MPTTRPSVAGPGAIGDREGARRNSWEPWTTDVDSARSGQDSSPQSMSIKAAARRASEFSAGGRTLGANGRAAGSPLARHRLSAVANLSVPEIGGTGTNFSALRRASQPAYVPFSQGTDNLSNGMNSLSIGNDNPPSTRASFTAGAPNSALRNTAVSAHRPSLPGLYNNSVPSQPDGGWNPYYFGAHAGAANQLGSNNSSHDSPTSLELSAAVAYGQGYDYRRDSGYGPSPPIVTSTDSRRDSYASQMAAASDLNNIRRTQSAWHIHDAFAAAPQIRHSSFSFMPNQASGLGGAGLSHGMHAGAYGMGANGAVGYGGQFAGAYNPSLMSMDSIMNSSHMLTQQHLLAEARRQSMNLQKALEFIQVPQQHLLIKELEGEVIQCAKDQNANHVLQRSLERIDCNVNLFISKAFTGQAFALATHPYGCRVLQKVFEHMPDEQTKPLLEELHRFSNNLMTDQYGNYVAQWIITDGKKEDAAAMLAKVQGQVLLLSKHKFASNVVEKAILKSTDEEKKEMIDEILAPRPDGTSTVGIMLKDAFANFPLQKFLQAAKEPQRTQLFAEVGEQLADMKKFSLSYGKYLVAIEKLVNNEKANVQFNTNISLSNSLSNNIAANIPAAGPITPSVTQIAV